MMQKHNQSKYFLNSVKYFDYFFTTKSYNLNDNELPAMGIKNLHFFNNTYDSNFHRPVVISENDNKQFACDVGFIGSFEAERAESIYYLAKQGIKVRVYGNGWSTFKKHPNLELMNQPIYGEELIKSICATKINLSFLRKANRDVQTNRTMEIPACGAFMLTERTDEHLALFEEAKEAEYFDTKEELLEKIKYYLKHEDKRVSIAKNARLRCLNSGYDMKSTLEKMLKIVKEEHNES
jgi:spore maturation protein CgeB